MPKTKGGEIMPGRDGTGPYGEGSMTGRGFGYCTKANVYRRGIGLGIRYRCRGRYIINADMNKSYLEEEKELLQKRIEEINEALDN